MNTEQSHQSKAKSFQIERTIFFFLKYLVDTVIRLLKRLLETENSMRDTLLAAFEDQKNVRSRLESIVGVSTAGGGVRACQCACQHVAQQPTVQQRRAGVANAQQRQAGDQFLSLPDYADSGTGTVNSLSSSSGSQDLHDWLKGLGVDDVSIQKVSELAP